MGLNKQLLGVVFLFSQLFSKLFIDTHSVIVDFDVCCSFIGHVRCCYRIKQHVFHLSFNKAVVWVQHSGRNDKLMTDFEHGSGILLRLRNPGLIWKYWQAVSFYC